MADQHHPVSVEPESVDRAVKGWDSFTQFTKYGVIGVTLVLILMAATLL